MTPDGIRSEAERLADLDSYGILDTLPEQAYDDLTALAACLCDVPIALMSLVDDRRQWFKSRVGLDVAETSRDVAFCSHAIRTPEELLVVEDALADERFAENPLVTGDPKIRFYAGAPLVTPSGNALGTLCVIDRVPRAPSWEQLHALEALSRQIVAHLELRRLAEEIRTLAVEKTRYAILLGRHRRRLEHDLEKASDRATRDPLTGLKNRAAFEEAVDAEIRRSARYGDPLAILMIDIDGFKRINDTLGHVAGDQVLMKVAKILEETVRDVDLVVRYGGDEFGAVLVNTDADAAEIAAERVRSAVGDADWGDAPVTVSAGVTILHGPDEDFVDVVSRADGALYSAKVAGRNRSVFIA